MTVMAAGLAPYAESVRTNSLGQVTQIAMSLMASGVTGTHDSSFELYC
jgi:hypothetical protein